MRIFRKNLQARRGLTLVELVLITVIISLLLVMGMVPAVRLVELSRYDADAERLDSFLQEAVSYAVLRSCTVEVVLSLDAGVFEAYEVYDNMDDIFKEPESQPTGNQPTGQPVEPLAQEQQPEQGQELIMTAEPLELFFVATVQPESGSEISNGEVVLRADGGGWQESFIVNLASDDEDMSRWIRCDRGTVGSRTYMTPALLPEPRADLN